MKGNTMTEESHMAELENKSMSEWRLEKREAQAKAQSELMESIREYWWQYSETLTREDLMGDLDEMVDSLDAEF